MNERTHDVLGATLATLFVVSLFLLSLSVLIATVMPDDVTTRDDVTIGGTVARSLACVEDEVIAFVHYDTLGCVHIDDIQAVDGPSRVAR
jgi:hypothetical protein